MKNFLQTIIRIKSFVGLLFIGMLALFLLSKAIFYAVYEVSLFEIVCLLGAALVYTGVVALFGCDYVQTRIGRNLALAVQGIVVVALGYLFNLTCNLFSLVGVQYFYFGLAMLLGYCAAIFGFWITTKMGVDMLNECLKSFNAD